MTLTRFAILDGRIDDAKKFVNEADTALGKARTDEAVFTKAEEDLKPPASTDAPASKNVSGAAPAGNGGIVLVDCDHPISDEKADRVLVSRWRAAKMTGGLD
jgi:hypothetical protein